MRACSRRRFLTVPLFTLLALLLWLSSSFAGQFKVTRVYDGDTVKAEGHDIEIKVRLVGIDAPETSRKKHEPGQPFSQSATKHLAGLVLDKAVDIKGYGMDQYNRILGVIFVDGKNVNLEMVEMGLAEVYDGRPPRGLILDPICGPKKRPETQRGVCGFRGTNISVPGASRKWTGRNDDQEGGDSQLLAFSPFDEILCVVDSWHVKLDNSKGIPLFTPAVMEVLKHTKNAAKASWADYI